MTTHTRSMPWFTWIGAAFSAGLVALAVADQQALGWTRQAVQAHYAPFGEHPDPAVLTSFVAVAALGSLATFVVTGLLAWKGRHRAATATAVVTLLAGLALARLMTFAFEFRGHVFIPLWRFAPWVLPLVAAVTLATLRRPEKFSGR